MAPVATVQPPTSFSVFKFNNLITATALTNQLTNQIRARLDTLSNHLDMFSNDDVEVERQDRRL